MCNKSSNITNREVLDDISNLGKDECVGRCLWCCLLRPRVDIGLAGSDAYCHQAYSTPDPPCLRPVKCATKRPIDRGQQCNWWSSTACGQDPAIVANLPSPRRWVDFSLLGWFLVGSKMVEPTITLLEIPSRDGGYSSSYLHICHCQSIIANS